MLAEKGGWNEELLVMREREPSENIPWFVERDNEACWFVVVVVVAVVDMYVPRIYVLLLRYLLL